jgi:hypothetical protein
MRVAIYAWVSTKDKGQSTDKYLPGKKLLHNFREPWPGFPLILSEKGIPLDACRAVLRGTFLIWRRFSLPPRSPLS